MLWRAMRGSGLTDRASFFVLGSSCLVLRAWFFVLRAWFFVLG
jgi:hypothetical protein